MMKKITRRDFLQKAAAYPLAGAFLFHKKSPLLTGENQKSRVVLIRDKEALVSFKKANPAVLQNMLDQAVMALLDKSRVQDAWKMLAGPEDIVGIKSNVWRYLPTPKELEDTIEQRLMDVGVKKENIGADDRGVRRNPIFQKATVLINARPARTHYWSGVGSLIKNYIMFVPRASAFHGDSCADLATIWKDFNLVDKTKLNVLVMLNPLFHSVGPHNYNDEYVWEYKGLIVSQDPVAADAVGLRIIEAKRQAHFGKKVAFETPAKHIRLAETRHGLGVADPSKIELIKLGWRQDILI
ncbi:MAG: DUF362 domain-containing protein [Candidatus Aminicenantes bacterium]|nr:DUF362 domain-containing protein [Candidatus Aminicenantes bacterium]